jgi:hypothetical protein
LANATRLKEAEALERAAKGELKRERGIFDPVLFADVEQNEIDERSTSPFETNDVLETESTIFSGGARMKLRFGTEIEASVDAAKLETNSTFVTVNPQYDADGNVRLRQPLLKGFGPGSRRDLSAAERLSSARRLSWRRRARARRPGSPGRGKSPTRKSFSPSRSWRRSTAKSASIASPIDWDR